MKFLQNFLKLRNKLIKKSQKVSKSQHKDRRCYHPQTNNCTFYYLIHPLVESTCEKVSHFIAMTLSNSILSFFFHFYAFCTKLISVCMLNMIEKLNDEETLQVDSLCSHLKLPEASFLH